MKNKKGFIATSLIYSFLILFSSLVLIIVSTYTYYRTSLETYNGDILINLNDNISNSYVSLENKLLLNNGFENGTTSWSISGLVYTSNTSKTTGEYSIRFGSQDVVEGATRAYSTSSSLYQNFNCTKNHYYYISFNIFASGYASTSIGNMKVTLNNTSIQAKTINDTAITLSNNGSNGINIPMQYINWKRIGIITYTNSTSSQIKFDFTPNSNTYITSNIDDIIITDITDIVTKIGTSKINNINNVLTSGVSNQGKLDYFDKSTSYNLNKLKQLVN